MNENFFSNGLTTRIYGRLINYYPVINSTNTRALEELTATNLAEGTAFIAGWQTNGRGSFGNNWESPDGENLLMSMIAFEPLKQSCLTFVPAIAANKTLASFGIQSHVKWPNDVLVGSKKISGILCEDIEDIAQRKAWVIGIGLNINQNIFSDTLKVKATSMCLTTGIQYDIGEVFRKLMAEFEALYLSDIDIIREWKNNTRILGQEITAVKNGTTVIVKAMDVSIDGHLIVQNKDGSLETWPPSSDIDILTDY